MNFEKKEIRNFTTEAGEESNFRNNDNVFNSIKLVIKKCIDLRKTSVFKSGIRKVIKNFWSSTFFVKIYQIENFATSNTSFPTMYVYYDDLYMNAKDSSGKGLELSAIRKLIDELIS